MTGSPSPSQGVHARQDEVPVLLCVEVDGHLCVGRLLGVAVVEVDDRVSARKDEKHPAAAVLSMNALRLMAPSKKLTGGKVPAVPDLGV